MFGHHSWRKCFWYLKGKRPEIEMLIKPTMAQTVPQITAKKSEAEKLLIYLYILYILVYIFLYIRRLIYLRTKLEPVVPQPLYFNQRTMTICDYKGH